MFRTRRGGARGHRFVERFKQLADKSAPEAHRGVPTQPLGNVRDFGWSVGGRHGEHCGDHETQSSHLLAEVGDHVFASADIDGRCLSYAPRRHSTILEADLPWIPNAKNLRQRGCPTCWHRQSSSRPVGYLALRDAHMGTDDFFSETWSVSDGGFHFGRHGLFFVGQWSLLAHTSNAIDTRHGVPLPGLLRAMN